MGEMVLSTAAEEVSVVDVYDLASDIGKECEKIIEIFGADSVTSLMPKVIMVLELLEAMASRNESENTKMQELTDRIAYLESEKHERALFRERYQKELEDIEEQWRTESNDLVALVSRLQEENRRYQKNTSPTDEEHFTGITTNPMANVVRDIKTNDTTANLSPADFQVLQRFRSQIEKYRTDLKTTDNELQNKTAEVENLNIQIERLTLAGRESRKRQKLMQVQIRSLVEEHAEFLAQLQEQHREILVLRKRLGISEKENEDLTKCQDESDPNFTRFTTTELKEILNERDDLRQTVNQLQEEIKLYKPEDAVTEQKKNISGIVRKILQYKDHYHMNQTTHHGKKYPNPVSENSFVNYFRSLQQQLLPADPSIPYLKWLSLLLMIATLCESVSFAITGHCHKSLKQTSLSNISIDLAGNMDVWFIK